MATITEGQFKVLRSYVGEEIDSSDLQERYDRLANFDEVVLEVLRARLGILVVDSTAVITVDGITLNNTENIRSLRQLIKDFEANGGTGLETTTELGAQVKQFTRPNLR